MKGIDQRVHHTLIYQNNNTNFEVLKKAKDTLLNLR